MLELTPHEHAQEPLILGPVEIGGLRIDNRAVVAPMTRVSATHDGVPSQRMVTYYTEFTRGGFGLIVSEGIFPEELFGRAYARQPGLVTPEQGRGWRRVTEAVHSTALAEQLLRDGHADLISLGRAALANPDWPQRLRRRHSCDRFEINMLHPQASLENTDRWASERDDRP